MKFFRTVLLTAFLGMGGLVFLCWGPGGIFQSGENGQPFTIIVLPATSTQQIVTRLMNQQIWPHSLGFYAALVLTGNKGCLQAGEYRIPVEAAPIEVVQMMAAGRRVVHSVTIPEGLNTQEVVAKIQALPRLQGQIEAIPFEGSVLPETYAYIYGDTRQNLLNRMQKAMQVELHAQWAKRAPGLPFKTPQEALVLASIVEKETGVSCERARVSAVFINRLQKGMKLQADPTVVYGLTKGQEALGRSLSYKDLRHPTPYNTYVIPALPPTPITCPGISALRATLNPLRTKEVYFVADGSGGHRFSETLTGHHRNVQYWRAVQQKKPES